MRNNTGSASTMCNLLLAAMLVAIPATSYAQPPSSETGLEAGLTAGVSLFKTLRNAWSSEVVDPLTRMQATRSLQMLSNSLDDLALQKQQLADAVLTASTKAPKDFAPVLSYANDVSQQVSTVRERLHRSFRTLPASRQSEAGAVEQQLQFGLTTKWESMQAIMKELSLPDSSAKSLRDQTNRMVKLTFAMKAQVDSLITKIQKDKSN